MSTPPYPLQPQPMKRGWLEHHARWKIPLGCVTLIFLIGVFATILLTVVVTSFHNSEAYKQALARAAGNSQVRQQMGEPMKPSWFISGQLQGNGSTGNANLSIPISGAKGKGSIRAVAYQSGGVWRFTYLQVSIDGQPGSIDLLSVQPPAERDF
jgi:Cytochrome oxidase complex assembly protein 1